MSLTDHLEAMTGIRQGDVGLFETGRTRREVAQVQRPYVLGDPDDPDAIPADIPAHTARLAAALAAQGGIETSADHRAQRAARRDEHDRQAARIRPPRHADYAEHAVPHRQGIELANVGDEPWNGSLPVYAAGAR